MIKNRRKEILSLPMRAAHSDDEDSSEAENTDEEYQEESPATEPGYDMLEETIGKFYFVSPQKGNGEGKKEEKTPTAISKSVESLKKPTHRRQKSFKNYQLFYEEEKPEVMKNTAKVPTDLVVAEIQDSMETPKSGYTSHGYKGHGYKGQGYKYVGSDSSYGRERGTF